jgi:hypothetical protein
MIICANIVDLQKIALYKLHKIKRAYLPYEIKREEI